MWDFKPNRWPVEKTTFSQMESEIRLQEIRSIERYKISPTIEKSNITCFFCEKCHRWHSVLSQCPFSIWFNQ